MEVADDGTVQGMEDAVDRVLDRYPFLVGSSDSPEEDDSPKPAGTRPVGPITQKRPARASLAERFPALRRRHRGR